MVQPMPAPGTAGTPYFAGQNVSQFIEQYERLCARHHVMGEERLQNLPEYCDYWIGMWIQSLPKFTASDWTELVRKLRAEYCGSEPFSTDRNGRVLKDVREAMQQEPAM